MAKRLVYWVFPLFTRFCKTSRPPHHKTAALPSSKRQRALLPTSLVAMMIGLMVLTIAGCDGRLLLFTAPTSSGSTFSNLNGNWELQFTSTSGATELTTIGGYLNDVGGSQNWATAAFQGTLSDCLTGQTFLPWYGNIVGTSVKLYSFLVTGEALSIAATATTDNKQFTGTYALGGPCANGATGNVVGTHYEDMTGTYSGSLGSNAAQFLKLTLTQNKVGTGNGTFFVTGSAAVSGVSCFTSATLAPNSGTVIGSMVQLQFTTNENPASTLTLTGSIDPTANTFTVNSAQVTGGQCSGNLGGASLTRPTN